VIVVGYIFQFEDGTFQFVHIKAPMNKYLKEAGHAIENFSKIVCRWTVKKKPNA